MQNKKADIEEIASTLDFGAVREKLEALTTSGALRRKKTIGDLLDKMKPALLKAREQKVPYVALAKFLNETGIPVSEPTLRHYLQSLQGQQRKRRKTAKEKEVTSTAKKVPETVLGEPEKEFGFESDLHEFLDPLLDEVPGF